MTVGTDRGHNARGFVGKARGLKVTPHVAKTQCHNAINGRTTKHQDCEMSQRRCKVVEESLGRMKNVGGLRKLLHRGVRKVSAVFTLACAALNLVRLSTLTPEPALKIGNGARRGRRWPNAQDPGAETPSFATSTAPDHSLGLFISVNYRLPATAALRKTGAGRSLGHLKD